MATEKFTYWKRLRGRNRVIFRIDMDVVMQNKAWTVKMRVADRVSENQFRKAWVEVATREEYEDYMTWALIKSDVMLSTLKKKMKLSDTQDEIDKLKKQYAKLEKEITKEVKWDTEVDQDVDTTSKKKKKKVD